MALPIGPIPASIAIVDKDGLTNVFFQLRWAEVRAASQIGAAKGVLNRRTPPLNAALATVSLFTTLEDGFYRLSYYLRKVVADGAGSSLTATLGWVDGGLALTEVEAALVLDTALAQQSGSKTVWADRASDLTLAVAYASTTPGAMQYVVSAACELIR